MELFILSQSTRMHKPSLMFPSFYFSGRLHHSGAGAYWGDPRAKSQSLDPMTLTATSSTSPSSIHSANSVAGLPRQQQHHQTGGPTPLTTAVSSPEVSNSL